MGLTPEQKKAKKEAKKIKKLAEEAEARKRLKREELRREVAAQAKKKDELERRFMELMMKVKEPVFKKEIKVMWGTFERAFDKKDHLIAHIMRLIDVADDQFKRTIGSFCDTIDTMINNFLKELVELSKHNDQATALLLKTNEEAVNIITKDHNTAETHLQLLLYTADKETDNFVWTTRGDNVVREDEERMKFANDRENLRSYLENNYHNMWDEYKAVLRQYVLQTADNQKNVRRLRHKENMMANIIASQSKRLANSDGLLKRLRTELAAYETGTKQAVFRARRDRHRVACQKLKQRMINGFNLDGAQLSTLVNASNCTLEWLSAAHKKGEKILRMAAMCRRYETQREKILPYDTEQPHSPTQTKTNVRRQQSDDSLVLKAMSNTCGLTRMWQRVAKAELTKRALLRERELLLHENQMIEKRLKDLNNKPIEPKCTVCSSKRKELKEDLTKEVAHPYAIEGALEANKIEKFYSQFK